MEPAQFVRFLVDVFAIPLCLFTGLYLRKTVEDQAGLLLFYQTVNNPEILPCFTFGNAHQFFEVRTDIIHTKGFGVQHDKNIVYVIGKYGEQFFPIENLSILLCQALAVSPDEQNDDYHG